MTQTLDDNSNRDDAAGRFTGPRQDEPDHEPVSAPGRTGQQVFNELQRLARAEGRASGKPVATQEYLTRHTLESFLYRLTTTGHAKDFILKRGLLTGAYDVRRPTKDVDSNAISATVSEEWLTQVAQPGHFFDRSRLGRACRSVPVPTARLHVCKRPLATSQRINRRAVCTCGLVCADVQWQSAPQVRLCNLSSERSQAAQSTEKPLNSHGQLVLWVVSAVQIQAPESADADWPTHPVPLSGLDCIDERPISPITER